VSEDQLAEASTKEPGRVPFEVYYQDRRAHGFMVPAWDRTSPDVKAAWAGVEEAVNGTARAATDAVNAALGFHERTGLFGNAATDDEPGNCPHHPDSPLHFEDGDGSGEWLCEGKPEGAVCSTCVDGEGGGRMEWPCPEYSAIAAALAGKGNDHG
jgi:hypothetical protein